MNLEMMGEAILVDMSKYEYHSTFIFEVDFKPKSQKRAKHGKEGRMYNPSLGDRMDFIATASDQLREYLEQRNEIIENPSKFIHIYRVVYFEKTVKGTEEHEPSLSAKDIDNMEKFIFDALQGVCYKNDNKCFMNTHAKLRSEIPKVSIMIKNYRRK